MRPTFTDPRTGMVFRRLFGSEPRRDLLIALLNDLLELDEAHRIAEVEFLPPAQRPEVAKLRLSLVDVRCRDAQGVPYIVKQQVHHVEGFDGANQNRPIVSPIGRHETRAAAHRPRPRQKPTAGAGTTSPRRRRSTHARATTSSPGPVGPGRRPRAR